MIAQGPSPTASSRTRLTGAAEHAARTQQCAFRYVLSDDLTRLCAALAYSKGARALQCVDLIRAPAPRVWVEWSREPWIEELRGFGFHCQENRAGSGRRRGALIEASSDGRRGAIHTFWDATDASVSVFSSPMRAQFDLAGLPETPPGDGSSIRVSGDIPLDEDVIAKCLRFQFEQSWADYYGRANLATDQRIAVTRHCLGTIAPDIPLLFAFFLLLATRGGLPQTPVDRQRLNRSRQRDGRPSLLDHIEVNAPFVPYSSAQHQTSEATDRWHRARRLHAVRGHLVRRGSQIFWRIPHLRGCARWGVVRSRTVSWQFCNRS